MAKYLNDTGLALVWEKIKALMPNATSDLINDSGFGTYTKPNGGIPFSDMSSAVQTSLGKADTAYNLNLGTAIPANANLNTYTTVGVYNTDSTVVGSITNAPITTVPYKLIVESIDDTVIRQIVITSSSIYQRTGDSSSSSWAFSDWVEYITSADFCTQAEIEGMLSANGFDAIVIEEPEESLGHK